MTKNDYRFMDTCSLLLKAGHLFDNEYKIVISSISLQELEDIKTANNKDAETKYSARKVLNVLNEHPEAYEIWIFKEEMLKPIVAKGFTHINNDLRILACAFDYDMKVHPDETIFVTNDLALKAIANCFFGEDSIESVNEEQLDNYTGYIEVQLENEQLSDFYGNLDYNWFNLFINQYLIIKDCGGSLIDRYCWTGETHRQLSFNNMPSKLFGKLKPYKDDIYQQLVFDCLQHNELSVIRGVPGSGKSLLALGYLFHLLDKGKIDNIVIFCNTVAVKDAAKLGYMPGGKLEKLMDSQIGSFLSTKFGSFDEVERLIAQEKLTLIPVADCRGMSIKANTGVYMTEAQNTNSDIMKLILQRIEENCVCVIEGDDKTQVDLNSYNSDNGLKKLSKIFRGQDYYGEVTLKTCHRSKIAAQAELMN